MIIRNDLIEEIPRLTRDPTGRPLLPPLNPDWAMSTLFDILEGFFMETIGTNNLLDILLSLTVPPRIRTSDYRSCHLEQLPQRPTPFRLLGHPSG
jgi:hypothetical protein